MKTDAKIILETTDGGENLYYVVLPGKEPMMLDDYLETYLDKTDKKHEIIRQHIVIATRNYHNRFQVFMREILMNKNNPMCIKHWSVKTEFQGRGAGERIFNNHLMLISLLDSIVEWPLYLNLQLFC